MDYMETEGTKPIDGYQFWPLPMGTEKKNDYKQVKFKCDRILEDIRTVVFFPEDREVVIVYNDKETSKQEYELVEIEQVEAIE